MAGGNKLDGGEEVTGSNATAIWKFASSMASKMIGGMAGLAITALTETPLLGRVVSNVLVQTLEKVGTHVIETKLGPRQKVRVGRAIAVAALRMEKRMETGEKVRSDTFVQLDREGRSSADEAVESALFAAMNSAEEKKVDFIGALMTSIVLEPSISASDAQQMIETAQSLRYRAYVILKIASEVSIHGWPTRGGENVEGPPANLYSLMAQIYDMSQRGLIEMRDAPNDVSIYAVLSAEDIEPSKLQLTPLGRALYTNMELQRIPEIDATYASTVADLKALSGYGRGPTGLNRREL